MGTTNSWNNQIAVAKTAITLNTGSPITLTSTTGAITLASGTGNIAISNDAANTACYFGAGAGVKIVRLGSTNTTSDTRITAGTTGLTLTTTTANGPITVESGTGQIDVAADATNSTLRLGVGAGVKAVTLGSTNTTSSTVIKSGTGNIVANSGLTIDSTGRNYNTAQPAFLAINTTQRNDVTGDGTQYTLIGDSEYFDQGGNFDGTSTFTAPITGKYKFGGCAYVKGLSTSYVYLTLILSTTAHNYSGLNFAPAGGFNSAADFVLSTSWFVSMTAGDTAVIKVACGASAKTVDIFGNAEPYTYIYGYLVC